MEPLGTREGKESSGYAVMKHRTENLRDFCSLLREENATAKGKARNKETLRFLGQEKTRTEGGGSKRSTEGRGSENQADVQYLLRDYGCTKSLAISNTIDSGVLGDSVSRGIKGGKHF